MRPVEGVLLETRTARDTHVRRGVNSCCVLCRVRGAQHRHNTKPEWPHCGERPGGVPATLGLVKVSELQENPQDRDEKDRGPDSIKNLSFCFPRRPSRGTHFKPHGDTTTRFHPQGAALLGGGAAGAPSQPRAGTVGCGACVRLRDFGGYAPLPTCTPHPRDGRAGNVRSGGQTHAHSLRFGAGRVASPWGLTYSPGAPLSVGPSGQPVPWIPISQDAVNPKPGPRNHHPSTSSQGSGQAQSRGQRARVPGALRGPSTQIRSLGSLRKLWGAVTLVCKYFLGS